MHATTNPVRSPRHRSPRPAVALAVALAAFTAGPVAMASASPVAVADAAEEAPEEAPEEPAEVSGWQEIESLVAEQKYQAALELVEELLANARAAGDEAEWTRALVERAKLTGALHGYETAPRALTGEPWPEGPRHRLVLRLFYARTLIDYLRAYRWEIGQRERLASGEEQDLSTWTAGEIYQAALAAYATAWEDREAWGGESLGELSPYLVQNDYPARIRGTLRDAVSYLWAELLGDSSLWRPDHANETYRLDAAALAAEVPPALAGGGLADPEVHPLAKLVAVLVDLEAWHREAGRPEAAFEARRARLERLAASFDRDEDRCAVRASLESATERLGRRYPWWSMGMASLAEMVRDGDDPAPRVAARDLARRGEQAHPGSVGGRRCRHLVASLEAPNYRIQTMTADGPRRRSLEVTHANLAALYFRAYRLDLASQVLEQQDWPLLPRGQRVPELVAGRTPEAEWRVALPPTPDLEQHRSFVTPPLAESGLWLVVASAREDFAPAGNQLLAVDLVITDLVLLTEPLPGDGSRPGAFRVTVRSGDTGDPQAGVEVGLWEFDWNAAHRRAAVATTGADGVVELAPGDAESRRGYFLFARRGGDAAVDGSYLYPLRDPGEPDVHAALVFTDRTVYRPGQQVLWKVLPFGGDPQQGRLALEPGAAVTVELIDANGQQVDSVEAVANDFGSLSGRFAIPPGRLLGGWSIRTEPSGHAWIQVEEYKRPTFEVTLDPAAGALRLNREATLGGEARYYFGLPVAEGEVAWTVTREPVYPDWWSWWGGWSPRRGGRSQVVAAGEGELAADGGFRVSFTPEADEREAKTGLTYRFRLAIEVTDPGGETRSASRAFRLGFVAVEARIDAESRFFRAGEPAALTVTRSDLDGAPRPGRGSWRLLALEQPPAALLPAEQPLPPPPDGEEGYRTAGDQVRPRWDSGYRPQATMRLWPDAAELGSGALDHGADGAAEIALPPLAPGAYRLRYSTEDDFGAVYETEHELVVAAAGDTPLALPAALWIERPSVPVGGTVRLLLHSALPDQRLELELLRDGRPLERRRLASGPGPHLVEIPVGREHRGGFAVRLTALRDHQLMRFEDSVFVPWDDRRLEVAFETFRDRLRPGDHETWRVRVSGADGEPPAGAAELLAYMYDRSLDLFAEHEPPSVLALYPHLGRADALEVSLGSAGAVWQEGSGLASVPGYPRLQGDRLSFYDGYGIGGPGRRSRAYFVGGQQRLVESADGLAVSGYAEEMVVTSSAPMVAENATVSGSSAEFRGGSPQEEKAAADQTAGDSGAAELRSDFAETALWEPHLVLGDDGSVAFELEVPDSVTEWSVWVHAVTRDLRGGSLERRTRTVKELLARPYLPRFLRQGDRAEVRVALNNAGDVELSGRVDLDVVDPESGDSRLAEFGLDAAAATGRPFTVAPGGGATVTFPLVAPARLGAYAVRVVARAGDLSDGEQRPLPVLPGRIHLAQSRFAALGDDTRRVLEFPQLAAQAGAAADPTLISDQLVVTVDGQLFYSVLSALPYLIEYPYECTEQTLNRFLSTGIVTAVFESYPQVAAMAAGFAERDTRLEAWDEPDPNRKMLLEETPWLRQAAGGPSEGLIKVLDPKVAAAQRDASLAALGEAQTSLGAFPWWPGGPPSPYMTLYVLLGLSRALEHGVEVPQDMVQRAWGYMHRHWIEELVDEAIEGGCCVETITLLNYVLSAYPDSSWTGGVFTDDDRRLMLDHSFAGWRHHAPRLKAYLALTLARAGRADDARLVFDSIMDSAKTDRDLGTYWAPEERAWLWYNDTVETHAFILRALSELGPDDPRRSGLVQWLLLDKKLGHWKSTRATAEAIYALVYYLEREGILGAAETARVEVGQIHREYRFAPDEYTGAGNQLVIPGGEIDPATMSRVVVEKDTPAPLFASATWHFSTERLPVEGDGDLFRVTRRTFRRVQRGEEWVLEPLAEGAVLAVGDQVEVQLTVTARHAAEYVHLRDPRGAGFEPQSLTSGYRWDLGLAYYQAVRDSGSDFFVEWLPAGTYTLKHRLRAATAGTFRVAPATLQSMYAPEFTAYSAGEVLTVAAE